jgi:hypothetical protein
MYCTVHMCCDISQEFTCNCNRWTSRSVRCISLFHVLTFWPSRLELIVTLRFSGMCPGSNLPITSPELRGRLLLDSIPLLGLFNHSTTSYLPQTGRFIQWLPKKRKEKILNPEEGNRVVCRIVGKPSIFYATNSLERKSHVLPAASFTNKVWWFWYDQSRTHR